MASESTDIVLAAVNARYTHASFGLRCLLANLGPLRNRTQLLEFTLSDKSVGITANILKYHPRIIGIGVYIWNVTQITELVKTIKTAAPKVIIVLGGPEVSHETESFPAFDQADYIICGEGERAFRELAESLLDGQRPSEKIFRAEPLDVPSLDFPYAEYTTEDIQHRVIYVESSRGCPFRCAFCLSSLDSSVRHFPLDSFLGEMGEMLNRGALRFKFVDRTFNLHPKHYEPILNFFLARWQPGMQLHFEIMPERVDDRLITAFARFPKDALHLEVGVQSFQSEVLSKIGRKQDSDHTDIILHDLLARTGARLHADLLIGLPGETWDMFASGFSRLITIGSQEVQVGMLKRLRGSPISGPAYANVLHFSDQPPYEIVGTSTLTPDQLQRLKRFAAHFDLLYNRNNLPQSLSTLFDIAPTPFDGMIALSERLWQATGQTHGIELTTQAQHLHAQLVNHSLPREEASRLIHADLALKPGRKERLDWLI